MILSPNNSTEKGEWIYAGTYLKTQFTGTSASHSQSPAPVRARLKGLGNAT